MTFVCLQWRRRYLTILLLCSIFLAACTPMNVKRLLHEVPTDLPVASVNMDVPFYPQSDNYCGPATLAMVLNYHGVDTRPKDLLDALYIPKLGGSLQVEMKAAARHNGLIAYEISPQLESLLRELAKGHPVIVLQNLGLQMLPKWHYAVALGYDLEQKEIILHSGSNKNYRLALRTFAYTWQRAGNWAIVPLPIGKLPAANDSQGVFLATQDLVEIGLSSDQVEQAYLAGATRWPSDHSFAIALSNHYYANKDYFSAQGSLDSALKASQSKAPLLNNLAYVLLARHCFASARMAINCAVRYSDDKVYRESWQEIEGLGKKDNTDPDCPIINCALNQ